MLKKKDLIFLVSLTILATRFDQIHCYKIVCDYVEPQRNFQNELFSIDQLPANLCTHINYNFLYISNDFSIMFSPNTKLSNLRKIVKLKSQNPDLKIMCSIGGWDQGSLIFSIISNNALSRTKFSMAVVKFVEENECDGVNIVWLHPGHRSGIPSDKYTYGLLLKDLKAMLAPGGYLLSVSGAGIKELIEDGYDIPAISK